MKITKPNFKWRAMTLRQKTLLIIGATGVSLIAIAFVISQTVLMGSYAGLERQNTSENVERSLNVISDDIANLDAVAGDWAPWDDTYAFVEDLNEDYIESNLVDETFINLSLNVMLFVNRSGQIVYGKAFDLQNEQATPISQGLEEHLKVNDLILYHHDESSSIAGIILLPEGPLLISSYPILTSERQGPVRGALIIGRYLDSTEVDRLAGTARLSLTLQRLDGPEIPYDFEQASSALSEDTPIFVHTLDNGLVAGYAFIEDVYGEPVLMLRVDSPRTIYQQGQESMMYFMAFMFVAGVAGSVAVLLLMRGLILSPLSRLSSSVSRIGASGDMLARILMTGKDEMSGLVSEINGMLDALKKSQEELKHSEEYFRNLIENAQDAMVIVGGDGTIAYGSPSIEHMLGYKTEELIGTDGLRFAHPDDMPRVINDFAWIAKCPGAAVHTELSIQHKDGSWRIVEAVASNLLDNQAIKGIVVNWRDITERKRMEEALQQSELNYRLLFDSMLDGLFVVDSETMKVVLANESGMKIAKIYGFDSPTDLNITDIVEFFHPDDKDRVIKTIAEDMFEKDLRQINEFRMLTKDGREIWISAVGTRTKYQGKSAGLVSMRDVTERKRIEEDLRRLSDAVKMTTENIVIIDLEGKVLDGNEAAMKMYGADNRADLIGMEAFDIVVPEEREKAFRQVKAVIETEYVSGLEYHVLTRDGRKILVEISLALMKGSKGEPLGFVGVSRDVTEHKQMEEAIKESETRYRLLADNIADVIFFLDMNLNIIYVSPSVTRLYGYTPEELQDKGTMMDLLCISMEDMQNHFNQVFTPFASGDGEQTWSKTVELEMKHKDGHHIWVEVTITLIYDPENNQPGVVGVARDITKRKEMEQQLQNAGRLAAVGELAAGVAHELNNPLAAIQGYSQLMASRNDLDELTKKDVETIYREALRAGKITKNLLSFARRHEPEKRYISINETIEKALELGAHQMKVNNIEVVKELQPDLPDTMADFYQMQQVFTNIAVNAEQAMSEAHGGGKLIVRTQKSGDVIQVSFIDDGPGISEENLKRIFDPFFTTKDVGKGTGLGLSICYGIVEAHKGRVYARSKLGEGASFFVEIPIVADVQQA